MVFKKIGKQSTSITKTGLKLSVGSLIIGRAGVHTPAVTGPSQTALTTGASFLPVGATIGAGGAVLGSVRKLRTKRKYKK